MLVIDLQKMINGVYTKIFGRTPLQQRLDDILKEAMELHRYTDLKSLKEEAGDLMTTLIQLTNEAGWSVSEMVEENLEKIKKRKSQYLSLGRKTQVAILGGAFDMVTKGHIEVAQLILKQRIFDEVYLMPCYAHVYNKKMVSPEHRLKMCEIATRVDGRIRVFDYEVRNKLGGETYNLAKRLFEDSKYSDSYSFSFVIGLDNANTFDTWVNYIELERLARFIVVPRVGEEVIDAVNWFLNPPHIFLRPDKPLMEISSTIIRNDLKKYSQDGVVSEAIKNCLDEEVFKYIQNNKLYI